MVEKPFKMIVYAGLVRALWSTGIEDVAGFEGEESADIGDEPLDGEEHPTSMSLLHGLPIAMETETEVGYSGERLFRNPLAQGSRSVESLAYVPGQTLSSKPLLPTDSCKIDAQRQGIIISVGETLGNRFPQSADTHSQNGLKMDGTHEVGHEERLSTFEKSRVGLGEDHRFLRYR